MLSRGPLQAENDENLPSGGWVRLGPAPLRSGVKLTGFDAARVELLRQCEFAGARNVLDIGCGTGTLAISIKRLHPGIRVTGLDPDPKALERARRKAQQAGISVQFEEGFSNELPYADESFDRVFSSLMFHHLQDEHKVRTLEQVQRVLAPGGSLHLMDFVRPEADANGWSTRRMRSTPHIKDNSHGRVLELMTAAGYRPARWIADQSVFFGLAHVAYYRACKR